MIRRIGSDDLDQLLDLVEKNRTVEAREGGAAAPRADNGQPAWTRNHDFWVEQLKEETSWSWSDEQYADAASLINFAEHHRVVLKDFVQVLSSGNDNDADADGGDAIRSGEAASGGARSPAGSTDQILLRTAFSTPDRLPVDLDHGAAQQPTGGAGDCGPDRKTTDADQQPGDLTSVNAVRSREPGVSQFNQIRADLFVQSGIASLRPYASWDDFQQRNSLPDPFVADLKSAYPDGFEAIDLWVGGLAEVSGLGAAAPTLQAAMSDDLARLDETPGGGTLSAIAQAPETPSGGSANVIQRASGSHHLQNTLTAEEIEAAADLPPPTPSLAGEMIINGTDAGNLLVGGLRDDVIRGGAGDDVIHGRAGDDQLFGDAGNDTLRGGQGNDRIHGGSGDDIALGGTGDDQLYGEDGDDILDGGDGVDLMAGGHGDDTIYIEDQADVALEYASQGIDTVRTTLNVYVLPDNIEILIFSGDDSSISQGTELSDFISDARQAISLQAVPDAAVAATDENAIDGLQGEGVAADLIVGLGSDAIDFVAADRHDVNDTGDRGSDAAASAASFAAYELTGNVQVVLFVGETGIAGTGNNLDNFISGSGHNDMLSGLDGDDTLLGGGGNDLLDGGCGDDTLDGGAGDDWVIGGQGDDYVVFTRGNDTLVLRPGFGNDVVVGFDTISQDSGGRDRIDVSAYGFSSDSFGVDILLIYDGDSTLIQIGSDSVKLFFVDANAIDRQDFIFS